MFTPYVKPMRNVFEFLPGDTFGDRYIMKAEQLNYEYIKLTVAEYEDGENSKVIYVSTGCQTDHWTW